MDIAWTTITGYLLSGGVGLYIGYLCSTLYNKSATTPSLAIPQSALDIPGTPIWIVNHNGIIRFCNRAFAALAGTSEHALIGRSIYDLQQQASENTFIGQLHTHGSQQSNTSEIWCSTNGSHADSECYEVQSTALEYGVIYLSRHITQSKGREQALIESDTRMNEALKVTNIGVWEWDIEKDVWFASPSYFSMLGYDPVDGVGDRSKELNKVHPDDRGAVLNAINSVLSGNQNGYRYQCRIQHANGEYRWVNVRCTVTEYGSLNKPSRMLGVRIDIDALKKAQQQVEWMANHDPLTQLPNRSALTDFFNHLVSGNIANMALLFIDLDRFKNVNDTLGHRVGDLLLVEVAKRLRKAVGQGAMVVRQGGDEYVVLCPQMTEQSAVSLAKRLQHELNVPYQFEQHQLVITCSLGISLYPRDGTDLDTLYKRADTAMYNAKYNGRNRQVLFTQEMQARLTRSLLVVNALHNAMDKEEFTLHFQPQFSLEDNRLIAAEALLRWHSETLGTVSPGEFIPIAEDHGQIVQIGDWVIAEAVKQIRSWQDKGYSPLKIAVNLSYAQFQEPNLPSRITQLLQQHNVAPHLLELELTERIAMDDPNRARDMIHSLHAIGIETSIDDFGTGYSSLSYLQQLPVYKLKIDQSFVRNINSNSNNRAIVSAIIALAKKLGMKTIAEGVETTEQLNLIAALQCDEAQGYLLGRPVPASEFLVHFTQHENTNEHR